MGKIVNTLERGIATDFHERTIPSDAYINAVNMVEGTTRNKMAGLSLEPGNETYLDLGDVYVVGFEYDEGRDWLYIFLIRGGNSEIGYVANRKYTKILSDDEYECKWNFNECERIHIEIKYFNNCEEPHLYWTNGGVDKVINVTEMLHEERRKERICNDFILLRGAADPFIRTNILDVGGASAEAGVYQFFVQLEDDSGNKTNWSHGSEIVRVGSENNIPGELSKHAIQVQVNPLDDRYDIVNLAVRKTVNGVSILQRIFSGQYSDNGFTYVYYGKTGREITLTDEEVLQKKDYVYRNYEIHQSHGVLYFYQIPTPKVLDYQYKANEIELYPVFYAVRLADAHKFTQLARDENYIPHIRWNYEDGTTSYWFPCTGQAPLEIESCGDYDWIKNNNAVVPDGIIPRFTSAFGGNYGSGAGGCCGSAGSGGDDTVIRTGGGCNGGTCGIAGDTEGGIKEAFRAIPDLLYPAAQPSPTSELYLRETYDLVKGEKFPNGFNAPNKDGDTVFSGNLFDDDGNFLIPPTGDEENNVGSADQSRSYTVGDHLNEDESYRDIDTRGKECVEPGDCTDCKPCDDAAVSKLESRPVASAAQEMARSCCAECDDRTIAGITTIAQAVAFCQDRKATRLGKRNDSVGWKSVDEGASGEVDPGAATLVPRSSPEDEGVCWKISEVTYIDDHIDARLVKYHDPFNIIECDGKYYLEEGQAYDEVIDAIAAETNAAQGAHDDYPKGVGDWEISSTPCPVGLSCSEKDDDGGGWVFPNHSTDLDIRMEPVYAEDGCTIIGYKPYKLGEGKFGVAYTNFKYPTKKDCKGRNVFRDHAGKNVRLFKTPGSDICPTSFGGYGVVDKYNLDNTIGGETYAILIGLGAKNVQFPTEAETPKKLSEHKPFEFGFAKRDQFNETKIAEGITINTFDGYVYGQRRSYFRHGVNSVEKVDRHIYGNEITLNAGAKVRSRLGLPSETNRHIYGFFSPDTMYNTPPLYGDYVKPYDMLKGSGSRHGLYERGPAIDDNSVGRRNQKCARQSIFLSTSQNFTYAVGNESDAIDVRGIDYVDADTKTNIPGIELPIVNKKREAIVAMQVEDPIRIENEVSGDFESDSSFNGYIGDEHLNLHGTTRRIGIKRVNLQQYGPVEGMNIVKYGSMMDGKGWRYYNFDDQGRPTNLGKGVKTEGLVGDTFVQLFQFVRHSYVSDRVGDSIRNPGSATMLPKEFFSFTKKLSRKKYSYDTGGDVSFFENLRLQDCGRPPVDGDDDDIRTHSTVCGLRDNANLSATLSRDKFFPGIVNTLVAYVAETKIDLSKLETGDIKNWEVPISGLEKKNRTIDTSVGEGVDWYYGFLNSFYIAMKEMNRLQLWLRAALYFLRTIIPIATAIYIIVGALGGGAVGIIVGAIIGIILFFIVRNLIKIIMTDYVIDRIVGADECYPDTYKGNMDHKVMGFRDNFKKYNWDYSLSNNYHYKGAMPRDVSVCECSEVGNRVIYTNKQHIDSPKDAYRNNNANKYFYLTQDRGKLMKMYTLGNRLIAHTTDGIYVIRDYNGTKQPVPLIPDAPEGIYGIAHPNALEMTKHGAVFIDTEEKKLYLVTPSLQIQELATNSSMWFTEGFEFCKGSGCIDEKNKLGFNLGYDPVFDRLLVTKIDGDSSFTFSVSLRRGSKAFGQIVSFHNYLPDRGYYWNRRELFAVYGSKIMLHNTVKNAYTVFNGTYYGARLELIFNRYKPEEEYNLEQFTFSNIMLSTSNEEWDNSKKEFVKYIDTIFTDMVIYNEDQTSGLLELIKVVDEEYEGNRIDNPAGKAQIIKRGKSWRINEVADVTIDSIKETLFNRSSLCHYDKSPENYNFDNLSQFIPQQNNITGKYLGVILILNNEENKGKNLIVHNIITETNKK